MGVGGAPYDRKYDPTYIKITIKYKDPFDFQAIYQKVWYWCQNEGYSSQVSDSDYNCYETLYRERHYPGFSELWSIWKMRKKMNKYIQHELTLKFQILGKSKTEVVVDGKKVKMDIGELIVEIEGFIVFDKDMEKEWEKPIFNKFPFSVIKRTFKIRTIKKTLDYWEDKCFPKHNDLANTIKKTIGMKF